MKQRVVAAGETLAAAVRSANAALGSGAFHVGPAPALARRTASAGWFPPHAASAEPPWVRPVRRNSSDARAAGGRAIFFEEEMQDGVSSGPTQKQLRFAETPAGQRGRATNRRAFEFDAWLLAACTMRHIDHTDHAASPSGHAACLKLQQPTDGRDAGAATAVW